MPRRRVAALALVAAVLAGGVGAWALTHDDSPPGRPRLAVCDDRVEPSTGGTGAPGDPAPRFTLPSLDGGCVDTGELRDTPMVVNFWASWCNPCRREFPLLRDVARQHPPSELAIVGVTYRDLASDAWDFAERNGADWTLVHDEEGIVAEAYGVRAVPQTVFVRRDGTVASRRYGEIPRDELRREIAALLRS